MSYQPENIVAHLAARIAAGAGDNTEISGDYIDRQGFDSCLVVISWRTTLTAAKTLTLSSNIQDATDASGTGVADYGVVADGETLAAAVVHTGAVTADFGVASYGVNLRMANQFIRAQFLGDLSHTSADVADIACAIILGGAQELPAS